MHFSLSGRACCSCGLCKGLREERERLEVARDELQAEAIAKEEERASELDRLRREVADLSSRLEVRFRDVTSFGEG